MTEIDKEMSEILNNCDSYMNDPELEELVDDIMTSNNRAFIRVCVDTAYVKGKRAGTQEMGELAIKAIQRKGKSQDEDDQTHCR